MKKFKLFVLCCSFFLSASVVNAKVIYVKSGASGDGTSWSNAYGNLQTAIGVAVSGDQVWVKQGTYSPNTSPNGGTVGNHFSLKNGVAVYGGFAGTETTLLQRDISANKTILTGAKHIFFHPTGTNLNTSAVIDGVTISGGYHDCNDLQDSLITGGAGMYNSSSSPTINNCTFKNNQAVGKYQNGGGAIYNYKSNPYISNCTFVNNITSRNGGAISNLGSSPTIINCTFSDNAGPGYLDWNDYGKPKGGGGAIYINSGLNLPWPNPVITNCTFTKGISNVGLGGGGICIIGGSPVIRNCLFWDNDNYDIYGSSSGTFVKYCVINYILDSYGSYSNIITGDPGLGLCGDNGGPTETCAVSTSGSAVAIPSGDSWNWCPSTDQRGYYRPTSGLRAIGAYDPNGFKPVKLDKGLICRYPFNGDMNDESGYGFNGSANEGVLTTDKFGNSNRAYRLDGLNDYISASKTSYLLLDKFTCSSWIYLDAVPSDANIGSTIVKKYGGMYDGFFFSVNNDMKLQLRMHNGTTSYNFVSSNALTIGQWCFVAATYDGGKIKLYLNNNLECEQSFSGLLWNTNQDFSIGNLFQGVIDNVRIYNTDLQASEISSIYNSENDGVVAGYLFSGNADDLSGNGNNGIVNGAVMTADRFGNPDSAYYFDGNNDYITCPKQILPNTISSYTLSLWIKPKTLNGEEVLISDRYGPKWGYKYRFTFDNSSLKYWICNDTSYSVVNSNSSSQIDIWHNVVGVFDNDTKNMSLYVDGIFQSSVHNELWNSIANPTIIGRHEGPVTGSYFNGSIDDVRFYERVLTPSEISSLFDMYKISISVNPSNSGTTNPSGNINAKKGGEISVSAIPSSNYHFTGWTGDVISSDNPLLVTNVTKNMDITANFAINTYSINALAGANGSISPTGTVTVAHGSSQIFTIAPDAGYLLASVLVDGLSIGVVTSYTFSNVITDHSISASFTNTCIVNFVAGANGSISGTTTQNVLYGNNCSAVTGNPNTGYHFVNWTRAGGYTFTSNPLTATNITKNITITANFAINTYTLTFIEEANGVIIGTKIQTVNYGQNGVSVRAVPNIGYHFVNWTGDVTSTGNPLTITNVTSNMNVTANFAINTYTLTYTAGVNGAISGISVQTVDYGSGGSVVSAIPDATYHFVNWSDGSTVNPRTDTNVKKDINVTAIFTPSISGQITGEVSSGVIISLSGGISLLTTTDTSGNFIINVPTGNYTLTPSKSGYLFTPKTRNVIIDSAGVTGQNFESYQKNMFWSSLENGMNDGVYALACDSSGNLYAGGAFTAAGGVSANYIAKWNGTNWSALETGMNSAVSALACDSSGNLYAGGRFFTTAGEVSANRIAKWNGSTWSALGGGMNHGVGCLTLDSSENLYAGGEFSTIAKWNGSTWNNLGSGMADPYNVSVYALACDFSGNLYAGGGFSTAGGVSANNIAKWNGSTWSALGSGINGTVPVSALACDFSGNLYAGGGFNEAGSLSAANNIAKWNGSTWNALGSGMSGSSRWVSALACDSSGNLYAGGRFTSAGGVSANNIAKYSMYNTISGVVSGDIQSGVQINLTVTKLASTVSASDGKYIFTKLPDGDYTITPSLDGYTFNPISINLNVALSKPDLKNVDFTSSINSYIIVFQTDGTGGASITGTTSQSVNYDSNCTEVTANAPNGYHFVKWTKDDSDFSTNNPLTVTNVTESMTLTAMFAITTYSLTVNNGTGDGDYPAGTVVNIVADAPTVGQVFDKWTGDVAGIADINASTSTITVPAANTTITATYKTVTFSVIFIAGENGSITGNTNQTVNYGADAGGGTAVPSPGYTFMNWTGNYEGSKNPLLITNVTSNMTVTANFYKNNIQVLADTDSINIPEGGTATFGLKLSSQPAGNTVISIVVASGNTIISVTVGASLTFTTANWDNYKNVTLSAVEDDNDNNNNTATIICSSPGLHDKYISAIQIDDDFTLDITSVNGTVTKNPSQPLYDNGTNVKLTAVPNNGYSFTEWTGDLTGTNSPASITMNGNKSVTANFAIYTYTLTYTAGANGSITGISPQTVNHGSDGSTVTAIPNTGYHFINWSDASTANPRTDSNITANLAVAANFAVNTAELAYSVPAFNESDANDGSIDNSVPMTITISGDTFTGTDGDDLVVENKVFVANLPAGLSAVITKTNVTVLTVTLTGNATSHLNTDSIGDLTLVFADNAFVSDDASGVTYSSKSDIAINFYDYTITASAGAGGSISPSGITPINNGASQLFAISANAGYHILDVVVDSKSVGAVASYNFTAVANHTISATFAINTGAYSISGTVSGAATQGVTLTLSGTGSSTNTSAADGTFNFAGRSNGSYTVTPSLSGYTFTPSSRNITVSGKNVTGCDFVATKNPGIYSISGTVSGAIHEGVTIALSGEFSSTTVSAADGSYSFTGLADGSCTVTPELSDYTFTPYSRDVSITGADQTGMDFTATAISIYGQILKSSFNSSYKDSIKKINGSHVQYSTDKFTVQATIQFPETFDLKAIGENSGLTFDFGLYSFSDTLKNAFKKKLDGEKGGSASFKIDGKDEIKGKTVTVEKVELKWDKKKKLTVKITGTPASNSNTNVVDLSGKADNPLITGNIDTFVLTFNNAGASFESLDYTGKKTTKTVIKDKGKPSEKTFTLVNWSTKGKK